MRQLFDTRLVLNAGEMELNLIKVIRENGQIFIMIVLPVGE